jgi:hypothetical protein
MESTTHSVRDGFARIPDWLYREAVPALALTPREVAVYVVLVGRSDADGMCWPSQDLIAHEAGMRSRRSVREALDALTRAGLITASKGVGRQGTRYRVMPKPSLPDVAPLVVPSRGNGSHSIPFGALGASEEWGPEDPHEPEEWVRKDPRNGVQKTPEVDPGSRHREVDPLKPPSRGQRRDGAPASPRQLAFIADLTSALGHPLPGVESHEHAHGLIREYWHEMEHRRAEGSTLDGSITDLSPAGRRYAHRHGLTFTNRKEAR